MFARTTCSCAECVACCKRQPGPLAPGDFEKIAAALGETEEQARRHFVASKGAVLADSATGKQIRVGTITPNHVRGRCIFLTPDDRCSIHAVAPAGCALFDTHMSAAEGNRRGIWLALAQLDDGYQALRRSLPFAK